MTRHSLSRPQFCATFSTSKPLCAHCHASLFLKLNICCLRHDTKLHSGARMLPWLNKQRYAIMNYHPKYPSYDVHMRSCFKSTDFPPFVQDDERVVYPVNTVIAFRPSSERQVYGFIYESCLPWLYPLTPTLALRVSAKIFLKPGSSLLICLWTVLGTKDAWTATGHSSQSCIAVWDDVSIN